MESCERHPKHAEAVAWLLAASQGGDQQASEILQPHLGNLSEACRNRVEQDQSVLIVKPE